MSSRGRGGPASYQSTGSEDEGRGLELGKRKRKPRNKKHIQEKRFVIHPDSLCATRSELYQAQTNINGCTTIPIENSKSEREIREYLVAKLPKLEGKRFQFLTKGQTRNYFCPCSRECQDAAHVEKPIAEWNGKNIKKMAKGNRVVYILCLCKETAMIEGHEDEAPPSENVIPESVTSGSTNVQLAASRTLTEELLPHSASSDNLSEEEITSLVHTITLHDHNQNMRGEEERNDVNDNDDEGEEESESESESGSESESEEEEEEPLPPPSLTQQMHTDIEILVENPSMSNLETVSNRRCASGTTATQNRIDPDSAYDTLQTGSNTTLFTMGGAHQSQFAFSSPLNTPTEMAGSWRNQERTRTVTLVIISDLTPTGGSVVGGYNFFITLDPSSVERGFTGQYKVMFGNIPPVPAVRINDHLLQGIVPPSPRAGQVEVKLLNSSGETVSDQSYAVLFTYIDDKKDKYDEERRRKRKNYLKGEINSTADAFEMLSLVFEVIKDVDSHSKEGEGSNGNGKARALHLLRMIAESAAKINAMEFFTIIFSTPVGRTVFKSFKDEEILLEDVARENGHEGLASFLQERHLMYRDDENDSDDEVDWEALAKAAKDYQRRNAGREIIGSTSSEVSNGYAGDIENLSEHDGIVESCFEEQTEKQETTFDAQCQEEPHALLSEVESVPEFKSSLPKLSYPLVGRDGECEEIIGNLTLNQWRVGVISGSPGIGKTSIAVEAGHKLVLKGWNVRYHACTNKNPSAEIGMLLENHCHGPNLESDLISDDRNEKFPVQETYRTLLILDQLENVLKADEAEIIPRELQRLVGDTLDEGYCLQLLLVTRERIDLKVDFAFYLELEPLKSAVAVQLLQSVSQITSTANLEVIAKGCGYNPLAIMIVRALIQKGISENDIISMLSSSDNFWKKLSHNVVRRHLLKEKETLVKGQSMVQNESLTSPLSSLDGIRTTDQDTECNDEDEIPSYEKASDPRYCHCRLCTSSDGTSHLTLALGSSAFLLGLTLEDLKDVIQDKDLLQKDEGENPHSKGNNERTGLLVPLLAGLKILLRGSSIHHPLFNLKEALKKVREHVPRSCSYRPLCRAKSYASLDERGISLPSVTEKEPPTNIDQIEPVDRMEEEGAPCTCVGNPLLKSTPCLSTEDIIAAPSEFEGLLSRNTKTKLATRSTPSLKSPKIKRCSYLICCLTIFLSFCVGVIVYTSSLKGEEPVNDPAPEVKQPTAFTPKVNSSRMINVTFPFELQVTSVPIENSSRPSVFPRSSRCHSYEIELVDPVIGDHYCVPCRSCPHGQGLSPPCGSRVSGRNPILCKPCEAGKTFSSSFDKTSCKSCSQCAPNEIVVRPCKPSSDVVCSRCQPNQITWISSTKEKYECLDCPICPPGFEPSHPCGSTVPYGVLITCVQCREGETFSATTDREQCAPCSLCGPRRQRLIARCTKYFDTICGSISTTTCGYDHIQLNQLDSLNHTEITCIDCPICPAGMELSEPCGIVVYRPISLSCVSCRPGFTYSDQPSKQGCKPCTSCPPGAVVISHCSVLNNTACSTNSRCSYNQISFSHGSTLTCVDCIECSVGKEPSIARGSLVTVSPRQQCISCKPGTFSDSYGTEPCRPCQKCNKEIMVIRKCTKASNTVCLPCEANQYYDHKLSSCAPCSRCCKDEKDYYPQECSHFESRKCKSRVCLPSSRFPAKAVSPTALKTSTISQDKTKSLLIKILVPLASIYLLVVLVASIMTFRQRLELFRLTSGKSQTTIWQDDSEDDAESTRFQLRRIRTFRKTPTKRWQGVVESSRFQLRRTFRETQTKRWQDVAGEFTLEELNARHMEMYDWICRKLDCSFRRDYERLAKRYDRISREDRRSLRREASPSRSLLSLIETLYPSLTLGDFVSSLQEIGRNDIAQRLIPLVLRSNRKPVPLLNNKGKTVCSIEEDCV